MLIRHLWQLKTVVFLHWCLICAVLLIAETIMVILFIGALYPEIRLKVTDLLVIVGFDGGV